MAKVRLGFFSFTEITDPAEHRSYNEWHQLDHMPEQYPIPGVVFGQRWVSTPACRAARAYDDVSLARVHYLTLYLMGEPIDTTLEQFQALAEHLHAVGRFHDHRRTHLVGPFTLIDARAAPRVLVSGESVPYRPNRGIYVVVRAGAASGGDEDAPLVEGLLGSDGVAGVWTFATDPRFAPYGWHPGDKTITVCYLDEQPLTVAQRLGALVHAVVDDKDRAVMFAGPLETITPWSWDWFDQAP